MVEPMEAAAPPLNETTLLTKEGAAFTLEPVAITRMHSQLKLWSSHFSILYMFLKKTLYCFARRSSRVPFDTPTFKNCSFMFLCCVFNSSKLQKEDRKEETQVGGGPD